MILVFGGGSDIAKAIKGATLITHQMCDVTDEAAVEKVLATYHPEAVVNCAGVSEVGIVTKQSSQDWIQHLNVNLIGSYFVAKAAAKRNLPVVLIASVAGMYGKPEHSAYSASKGGVISLVQSLGLEGHKAYAISPGRVDTKMREKDYPGEDKRTRLTTETVAQVILDCIHGKYQPGDNIIIRKRGYRQITRVDKGQPWKIYLNVQPLGAPKVI